MFKIRLTGALVFISSLFLSVQTLAANEYDSAVDSSADEVLDCLLEPNEEIKLSSQIPGIIDKIQVERGDKVRRGQVVAQLKSGVERAAVALAQAKVDFGKRKLVRNEDLYKQELISIHEKDEMETEYRLAELELNVAKEQLKLRTLRSPISGIVTERHHSAGEFVGEDPVLTLVSIDPLNVEIIVPVSRMGAIHKGMTAVIEPESSNGERFTGKVDIVDPIIDAASGTYTVRVKLPNPKHRIAAGLKCQVSFKK